MNKINLQRRILLIPLIMVMLMSVFSITYGLYQLDRTIDVSTSLGDFSGLKINAYNGNENDIAYICIIGGTYNNITYSKNDIINKQTYKSLLETDKVSFSECYIVLKNSNFVFEYKIEDIITVNSYNALSQTQKNNFQNQYCCINAGTYNGIAYNIGDIIGESTYSSLNINQINFELEYKCIRNFIYEANYIQNDLLNEGLYLLLGESNQRDCSQAYISPSTKTIVDITHNELDVINIYDYIEFYTTSYTLQNGVISLNGGSNGTGLSISGLIITISFSSTIDSKVRVKVRDQWTLSKSYSTGYNVVETISKPSSDAINLCTAWTYYIEDGYAYYDFTVEKKSDGITIPFIEMGSSTYNTKSTYIYNETCDVLLDFELGVVQANRAEAVWG